MPTPRWLLAMALCATCLVAQAAELKVLTAGAFKPVLLALQPEFEARTGHRLVIDNDTAGNLQRRIAAGESFDAVISSPASLAGLRPSHLATDKSPVPVARVAIGVAVRRGAPLPDIASAAALRKTLLDARRIALIDPASGGSSGIYLARLFEQWGLADSLREKSVLVMGGLVAERVADGSAEIALHQISEILAVPGVVLAGPLPAEIQNYTHYSAAASARTAHAVAVNELLSALRSPATADILKAKGMLAPE